MVTLFESILGSSLKVFVYQSNSPFTIHIQIKSFNFKKVKSLFL